MRRILSCILVIVLLTSCSAQNADNVTRGFSCAFRCDYGDTYYEGNLKRYGENKTTLMLTRPPSVKGMVMTLCEDELTLTFQETSYTAPTDGVPSGMLVCVLADALDEAAKTDVRCIEGKGRAGAYTLQFDEQSGVPLTLTVMQSELTVYFDDVRTP